MRTWLNAKAEEEKRRQEEEKTRQEGYRLEQRKMEHDILRTSLQGGIPPPMIPVVFAGMAGGVIPPAALEWAQQYIYSQTQHSQPPALLPSGPTSPDHQRRDSQAPAYPPFLGEHNREAAVELAGLSEEDYARLCREGVLAHEPAADGVASPNAGK